LPASGFALIILYFVQIFLNKVDKLIGSSSAFSSPDSYPDLAASYCIARLGISRGSVSGGLKTLRQLGAAKLHYTPKSRKDHYVPEMSMERLVRGFIKDQFTPHLESSTERLDAIEAQLAEESNLAIRDHAMKRLDTLRTWRRRAVKLLPLALAVLGGGRALLENSDGEAARPVV